MVTSKHNTPGTLREFHFRLAIWALQKKHLDWRAIVDRYGVARSTAYKLLRTWKDANGKA